MKALTTRQPWAWAIVMGFKPLENRSRPFNHRGPLLIHSSLAEETHMVEDMLAIAAALVLERPQRAYNPVHCRGKLGLWQPPADVLAQLDIPDYVEASR